MRVYAKVIIIFEVLGICEPYINQPNVGTVLFSLTDLHKNRWTKSELGSLRARRYFQNLIPSPKLKDSLNDEYVLHLISYVQNCYNTVINEAETPAEHMVMANALSDVIGGYLKVWVLPITKYAYYGGTISPDNAIKLFQMYEDIKFSLKTDGQSWHSPNDDLLQSVTINIAPNPHDWYTRSIHDTCDDLAYYEKTDDGLTIPLPYINWDLTPQTMFIPLKNQSLVQLDSLNSSNALLDYYNLASSCIHSLNMGSIDDFGSRFQIWLSSDVVPHLKDDNLYIAFGSVLSILNKTKSFYKDVVNLCDSACFKLQSKALCAGFPIRFTKKTLIIAMIIFIELVWCIPVLYYILCVKKPKKKKHIINQFFKSFKKDPRSKTTNKDPLHGVKLFVKPRTRNLELDVEFPTYGHKYYMKSTSTNISHDNVTHINESTKKLSSKHLVSDNNKPSKTETKASNQNICNNAFKNNGNTMSSLTDNSTKTITLIEESEIKNLSYTHATLSVSKSVSNNKLNEVTVPDKIASTACNNNKPETIPNLNKKPKKCLFRSENKRKTTPVVMKIMEPNKRNKVEYKANSKERPTLPSKTIKPETSTKKRPAVANITDSNKNNEFKKSEGYVDHTKIPAKENIPKINTTLPKKKFVLNEIMTTYTSKLNQKPKDLKTTVMKDVHRINISSMENHSNPVEALKQSDEQRISIEKDILEKKIMTTQNKSALPEVAKANKTSLNERSKLGKNDSNVKKEPTKKSTIVKSMSIKNDTENGKPQEQPILTNIKIDSPRREIEIGIKSSVKPSKIPRRIFAAPINDSAGKRTSPSKKENASPRTLYRARKKTLDDTAIKKTVNQNTKLNTTF